MSPIAQPSRPVIVAIPDTPHALALSECVRGLGATVVSFGKNSQDSGAVPLERWILQLIEGEVPHAGRSSFVRLLEDKAVPCGPINTLDQAFADAQVQHRALVVRQPTQQAAPAGSKPNAPSAPVNAGPIAIDSIATVASPLRLGGTPPVLRRAPPGLGEHTDAVLAELGLEPSAIAALRSQGVL